MVIQSSYREPAVKHAMAAIGALHERIMQGDLVDGYRGSVATEFALEQCNKSIACLVSGSDHSTSVSNGRKNQTPRTTLTLITCILFTCFEAMQGRCNSAVNHALQGHQILRSTADERNKASPQEVDEVEELRPLAERLEVQAKALVDKSKQPQQNHSANAPMLPLVIVMHDLQHAHATLQTAINNVMVFMQSFNPKAPPDEIAMNMAEKNLRYAPWFYQWEVAFTEYLSRNFGVMSDIEVKRAMVLKANHCAGTMLARVDQSQGAAAYDAFEEECEAIVSLSEQVLSAYSVPPLPTLNSANSGTSFLSLSLWVTDPLWIVISRCRNPSVRKAAFHLLSQHPRQEGIWHAGPQTSSQFSRRGNDRPSALTDVLRQEADISGKHDVEKAPLVGETKLKSEWVDLRASIQVSEQTIMIAMK